MAADEMKTIRDLDTTLLNEHKHRLWMYFAEEDEWVGEQKAVVLRSFEADPETIRVVHGHHDIPHAFCISEPSVSLNNGSCGHVFCRPWRATRHAMSPMAFNWLCIKCSMNSQCLDSVLCFVTPFISALHQSFQSLVADISVLSP